MVSTVIVFLLSSLLFSYRNVSNSVVLAYECNRYNFIRLL
jgi:hypothetical protein